MPIKTLSAPLKFPRRFRPGRQLQVARVNYLCNSKAAGASFAENYVGIEGP